MHNSAGGGGIIANFQGLGGFSVAHIYKSVHNHFEGVGFFEGGDMKKKGLGVGM